MNNKSFTDLLRERRNSKDFYVNGDADLLIVQTGTAKTLDTAVNVTCEDTDGICSLWHCFI